MSAAFVSLLELNGRLRSGAVKAREVAREAARGLKAEAGAGGAVRMLLEDEAVRAARDVERELERGRTRGLLQGAPFGVSELLQTAGRAPLWDGSPDVRLAPDAAAMERLRRARALPLAVLASPPLGGVAEGFSAAETPCASVVARGLLPFAISEDFNGNVLRAALRQGCCALRPTFGTVNGAGAAPLGWTLGAVSAFARTAEDCGHVLAGMSGSGAGCAHSPGRTFRFAPQYARGPEGLRVLVVAGAAERVKKSGAEILAAPVPAEPCAEILEVLSAAEAAEALEEELEALEEGRQLLAAAREVSASDYIRAMRWRRSLQEWYAQAFANADLAWIGPGGSGDLESWRDGEDVPAGVQWLSAAILAGAPVLACGGREPFCVTGRPNAENQLLRFAMAAGAWRQD